MSTTITIGWIVGILLMGIGAVYLTGKKLIVPRWFDSLLLVFACMLSPILLTMRYGMHYAWPAVALLFLGGWAIWFSAGKFSIVNFKKESFSGALHEELDALGIAWEEDDGLLTLASFEDAEIKFREYTNTVEVNLRSVRKLPFYPELLAGLKRRVMAVEAKVFPMSGVFYLVLGVAFLLAMQWIGNRPCPL
jgi:hypothetical protein